MHKVRHPRFQFSVIDMAADAEGEFVVEARFALLRGALEEQMAVSVADGDIRNDLLMGFIGLGDGPRKKQLPLIGERPNLFRAFWSKARLQQSFQIGFWNH